MTKKIIKEKSKDIYNKNNIPTDKNHTIIILDWDDTLFPTSWILERGIDIMNPSSRMKYIQIFTSIDEKLHKTLSHLQEMGTVIIITNAMPEWVELASSLLPRSSKIIESTEIVSARKLCQDYVNIDKWKTVTFKYIIEKKLKSQKHLNKYANIISMGDAEYEHNALVALYNNIQINHKYLKSVKFIKTTDIVTFIEQLKLINKYSQYIVNAKRQLDLKFTD